MTVLRRGSSRSTHTAGSSAASPPWRTGAVSADASTTPTTDRSPERVRATTTGTATATTNAVATTTLRARTSRRYGAAVPEPEPPLDEQVRHRIEGGTA